jgi:hypothetical protein
LRWLGLCTNDATRVTFETYRVCGALLVVDSFLYFRHAAHFFSGDSVLLLNFREVSVSDYLKEFIQLNPSLWYRPEFEWDV